MSIIAAGTTTTTALSSTGNTDGTLQFQVNGTTASVTLNTLGAIGVGSSPSFGTSGQVLISGGSTAAPTWGTASAATTATNLAGGSNGTIPYQSAAGTTQMLAVGTSGQVLQTNGAGAPSWVTPTSATINVQTFTSSGTWTKPSLAAGSRVQIQVWGAGGSGGKSSVGAGGGGGGGYKERWVTLSSMGATETITIGAGGATRTTNGVGNVGGTTTVGTLVTAYGGGGGGSGFQDGCGVSVTPGAGGAGMFGPGVNQTLGSSYWGAGGYPDGGGGPPRYDGTSFNTYLRMIAPQVGLFGFNMGNDAFSDTAGAGGGGRVAFTNDSGNADRPTFNGGRAVWGGGGGGGTQGTTGGVSQFGGNGGAGGTNGTAGTQPAGGGGGCSSGTSGAGGAGQVIITVFPG